MPGPKASRPINIEVGDCVLPRWGNQRYEILRWENDAAGVGDVAVVGLVTPHGVETQCVQLIAPEDWPQWRHEDGEPIETCREPRPVKIGDRVRFRRTPGIVVRLEYEVLRWKGENAVIGLVTPEGVSERSTRIPPDGWEHWEHRDGTPIGQPLFESGVQQIQLECIVGVGGDGGGGGAGEPSYVYPGAGGGGGAGAAGTGDSCAECERLRVLVKDVRQHQNSQFADRLGALETENKDLLAENATLRREIDRLNRLYKKAAR